MYAGIGSRKTPPTVLNLMYWIGVRMAQAGLNCATGAAVGADQAFANGCVAGGGTVSLSLPWASYNSEWVSSLPKNQVSIYVIQDSDTWAYDNVQKYHPAPEKLKQGGMKLMARNSLILRPPVDTVICYTENASGKGGTGQAMRIASDLNMPVYDLGNPAVFTMYASWVDSFNK